MVMLTVLYDTAARVSELIDIRICDVRLDVPAVITLHGKGRKIRSVPLMKQTVDLLKYISRKTALILSCTLTCPCSGILTEKN